MTSAIFLSQLFHGDQALALGCPIPSFAGERTFVTATEPRAMAAADFNGDGKLDVALAAYDNDGQDNDLLVLLGNGDATFQAPVNSSLATGAQLLLVGDFNGDGKPDLVAVFSYSSKISALLGNGDGTFQASVDYIVGIWPFSVAVGDFNRDGKSDLALAIPSSGTVSVLLGNGDGSFATPVNYSAGAGSASVAAGDFNGDGKPDLAVVNQGSADQNFSNSSVSVLSGNGDGTFQAAVNFDTGARPVSVAPADFNGDGKLDLATINSASVSVLLGNGDGTFQPPVTDTDAAIQSSFAVGDFNGDGKSDLATAGGAGVHMGVVFVMLGNGDGTFQAPVTYRDAGDNASVAVGDFNGDGKPDLATAGLTTARPVGFGVSVLLGNGDGTFQEIVHYGTGGSPNNVAVGDLNGDGRADLAVACSGIGSQGLTFSDGGVYLLIGRGDGTFEPAVTNLAGSVIGSVALGDFNGDGKTDLAVSSGGSYDQGFTNKGVLVLLGHGDGTFQTADPVAQRGGFLAVGDFNSDGKRDLAVAFSGISDGGVDLLLGNGDGTFQTAVTYLAGSGIRSVALGDFNGDGKPDLAAVHNGQYDQNGTYTNVGLSVLLGQGDGTFQTASNYIGADIFGVAVSDFNGDGKSDLAVATHRSTGVVLLMGNGDGTFQTVVNSGTAAFPGSVLASDFNGDGIVDLGVATLYYLAVNLGNGDGTFQTALNFDPGGFNGTGSTPSGLAAGDINGDGKPDLAAASVNGIDARNGSVAVLLNTCVSGELPIDQDQDGVPDSEDGCPQSNLSPTVVIAGRDSGVANLLLAGGCTISDEIAKCSVSATNSGSFMNCVAHLTGSLKEQGIITPAQKGAIDSCAARSGSGNQGKKLGGH